MKLKMLGAIGLFGIFFQTLPLPAFAEDTKLFPSLTPSTSATPANSVPFSQAETTTPINLSPTEIRTVTTTSTPAVTALPAISPAVRTTTTSTTTTQTSELRPPQKIEQTVQRSVDITQTTAAQPMVRARIDRHLAQKMAKNHWLEKAVAADPSLIDAITQYSSAAKILAKHPRIGTIAEADHYTCRSITKWKTASRNLARNPEVKEVIDCDPEGMYRAIKRDSKIGKLLVKQPDFSQIVVDNPDLGKLLATHM